MKQRIITAVIAAALFIPFVVYGNLPFTILVYAMAAVGLFEMLRMKGLSLFTIPGIIGLLALFALLMPRDIAQKVQEVTTYSQLEYVSIFVVLLLIYTVLVKNKFTFDLVAFIIASVFYVGLGFHYFIETRASGVEYIIFALVIVWTTDSGAYFIGRKLGKHKLWPEISPKKTIEGFVGGIVVALIATVIFQAIADLDINYGLLLVVALVASIFGQLGDLVESAIKRHYGVKDSGKILPGHGGILDRFDSLLFVLPLLYFIHFIG
ncbi:phosphatidate cytidylyltransferase [Kurthia sibirica]|uniref:Phosphatidate cytidylyltransferase n=1 Tax=Kurthia sibirica TaxID=202750 RepID=A0A2U3AQZ1_9BACL|nr:phosphatidate cytidylyltransferase [Kurthia sibirica]PWI26929.1 phosphatidate cytidylyltransferase [Kurthia sibirica]GEK32529.1 phosphatidate cytidylyltransferase [Kurthia sibirica]